jgi:hypothetical protein
VARDAVLPQDRLNVNGEIDLGILCRQQTRGNE